MIAKKLATNRSISRPEQEVWWLLEHLLKRSHADLISQADREITSSEEKKITIWAEQRIQGMPLAYVLGTVPFGSLTLSITPPVFIPRPETEEWVAWLISELAPVRDEPLAILELCSGSGAIALSLAHALPASRVTSSEYTPETLTVARANAARLEIKNVSFLQGDLFSCIQQTHQYDLIVSNPPYLSEDEWSTLEPSITLWEDKKAFVTSDNGLYFYTRIARQAHSYLKQSSVLSSHKLPRIVMECADHQAEEIIAIFRHHGFSKSYYHYDFAGKKRVIATSF